MRTWLRIEVLLHSRDRGDVPATRPWRWGNLKFLHEHTETKIRQDVLHHTQVGSEFFTLQKKALQKGSVCNSAQRPDKNIARVVANSYVFRRIIKMACGSIFPVGRAARINLRTLPRFQPRYVACTNFFRRSYFFQSLRSCKSSVPDCQRRFCAAGFFLTYAKAVVTRRANKRQYIKLFISSFIYK